MKKIAFIGLGNMGSKMAVNLLKANYNVIGYDIKQEFVDQLKPKGLRKVSKIDEIPFDIDILITMLPNGEIVEEIYQNITSNFKPNTLFTDCSTIDVNKAKELHEICKSKRLLSLDAPVSGGVRGAEDSTLTFMVGGDDAAYKIMQPLFKVMGKKSVLCGPAGLGQAAKACNNMLLATTMIAVGESFNLGSNLGLDPKILFEILSTSTGSCWAINSYCPIKGVGPESPADNNFQPGFSANLMLKDLTIAINAAEEAKKSAFFGKLSQKNFQEMIDQNQGNLDFSAITKFNK
ncbi:3-hydroxyisobutyrate dehydrogenase [Alphaproteobacteria bacterium]|nr:3-hydroxyisobutyrate dehydrogenase [Alphaproteobacteria bacterium]